MPLQYYILSHTRAHTADIHINKEALTQYMTVYGYYADKHILIFCTIFSF